MRIGIFIPALSRWALNENENRLSPTPFTLERQARDPQPAQGKYRNAADLDKGHDEREGLDKAVAEDIHQKGEEQQPHAEHDHQRTVPVHIEQLQGIGPERRATRLSLMTMEKYISKAQAPVITDLP